MKVSSLPSTAAVWVLSMMRPWNCFACWSTSSNLQTHKFAFFHSTVNSKNDFRTSDKFSKFSSRKRFEVGNSFLDILQRSKAAKLAPKAINAPVGEMEQNEFDSIEEKPKSVSIPSKMSFKNIPRISFGGTARNVNLEEEQEQEQEQGEEEEEYKFEGPKRCGTVAIVGAPNAGKSTLMNHLVGSKIAIVTHKRQTTRNSVTGIGMEGGTQVIYVDTPGIMAPRPKERLNKAMVKSAWNSARDADQIFFIVDADKIIPGGGQRSGRPAAVHPVQPETLRLREGSNEQLVLRRLCQRRQRFHLILNKVDQIKGERRGLLIPLAEAIRSQAFPALYDDPPGQGGDMVVDKVFAVSAANGKGLDAIRDFLRVSLPLGEWHYPPDQTSSLPLRSIVAEITRESILLRAHEEVPYVAFVETQSFEEQADGSVRILQDILVETDGQKKILVGMIKDLGTRSRLQMSKFLERPVHLFLTVKAKKGWTEDSRVLYEKLGLDFNA